MINLTELEMLQHEYRKELLYRAERERLVNEARRQQSGPTRSERLMSWTGRKMVRWGLRLLVRSHEADYRSDVTTYTTISKHNL